MGSEGHPVLAAIYDRVMSGFERTEGLGWRKQVLAGCRGRVLDLGCGTGANFPVWQGIEALELHATEPDPHMLRRARARAARLGLAVTFAGAPAERLPYPDGFFDAVVTTLVLCTVADPARAIAEVARVLKPGGEFRFMEHVRAGGRMGWWQDRLTPLWRRVSGGCHLNRETGRAIAEAFVDVTWEAVERSFPVGRILLGRARKSPHV
ncbi:MAG: class I SAM-dependent methyltransferase [Bacillota bacterium]